MKKSKAIIVSMFLSLLILVMAAVPAFAAETDAAQTEAVWPDGLALVVPLAAGTGQPVTMTVFKRSDATPAPGAGIWAFTPDQAAEIEQQLAAVNENAAIEDAAADLESLFSVHGKFLGRTDDHGKLTYTFEQTGRYRLVAIKAGFVPGWSGIYIGTRPAALVLRAPQQAEPGEPVSLGVYNRRTSEPVSGAGIWAVARDNAEALQAEILALQESGAVLAETDLEPVVSVYGTFLGRTGDDGELVTSFEETGGYLLIAVKHSFVPARARIVIRHTVEPLAIEVQRWAKVGERVPVYVFGSVSGEAVGGAGVWALSRDAADALRQEIAAAREADTASATAMDWESTISLSGSYLGTTDDNGKLVASFDEPGWYVLVTWKSGYFPGFAGLAVRPAVTLSASTDNFSAIGTRSALKDAAAINVELSESR